ncbi:MAG TPA: YraN family protein [Nocardioidaceae bacterium]|nr:YraN family protein [Nocardioidaceae bacterium]
MTRQQVPTTQIDPEGPAAPGIRRREIGRYGEDAAARELVRRGMVVLDRNWRCDAGEIDLVLRDGRVLVVCEVKTRSSTAYGEPVATVTEQKAARLRVLAARWLEDHLVRPDEVRIDLVGVLLQRRGAPVLEHVPGVG